MEKTRNKKGFTLVELIIVVTILAILATIAFMSFQGYSGQARDAKKQSELGNIRQKIEVGISANSQSVLSFVSSVSGDKVGTLAFAGTGTFTQTGYYDAGNINYGTLGGDSTAYKYTYKIGAVNYQGYNTYQLATRLEDETIYTQGNYSPRGADIKAGTGASNSGITLSGSGIGFFKVGDTLTTHGLVTKVSSDLATITVTTAAAVGNAVPVGLASAESEYLISTGSITKE